MAMPETRPETAVAADARPMGASQPAARIPLTRWAFYFTFAGFIVTGLSLVGIFLAYLAKKNGEPGAHRALVNAIGVTILQPLIILAFAVIVVFFL